MSRDLAVDKAAPKDVCGVCGDSHHLKKFTLGDGHTIVLCDLCGEDLTRELSSVFPQALGGWREE